MTGWHWKVRWTTFLIIISGNFIGKIQSFDDIKDTSFVENIENEFHLLSSEGHQVNDAEHLLSHLPEDDPDYILSNSSSFASALSSLSLPSSTPLEELSPLLSSSPSLTSSSLPESLIPSSETPSSFITSPSASASSSFLDLEILTASSTLVPSTESSSVVSTTQSLLPAPLVKNVTTIISEHNPSFMSFPTKVYRCLVDLGTSLEQLDEGFQTLSQDCLETLLCTEHAPYSTETYIGDNIYWFRNMNATCYNELPSTDDNGVSKFGNISPTLKFMALHPMCVNSEELAHLEILDKELRMLPAECRKLLCYAGVSSLHYGRLPVEMFYPHVTDKYDYVDDCQGALDEMMNYDNISTSNGQVNIFHTSKYPETSPCSTYIIFAITSSGSHVIIPVRSTWCRPMKRRMLHDLMVSSYMEFLEGDALELYQCLAKKNHYHNVEKMHAMSFFHDLLGRNIAVPDIPEQCISFLCSSDIDLLNVRNSKSGRTLFWFSRLKNFSDSVHKVKSQLLACQGALPQGTEETVYSIKSISLPGSTDDDVVSLIPTFQWSCAAVIEDEEKSRLRSETLATLWLKDENLPEACKLLICNATIRRLGKDLVSAFVIHSTELSDTCQKYSEHMTTFDVGEYIFSFDVTETNSTVVFIIAESFRNDATVSFLSHLHVSGDERDARCCSGNYKNVDENIYNFNGNYYYSCSVNSSDSLGSVCLGENSLWNMKHIVSNTFLVTVKEDVASSEFIHWLATLDISMSDSSHRFLESLDIQVEHFLNNIIFVSNVRRSSEGFHEFLSEMRAKHVQCDGSQFFTLCYRDNGKFEVTKNPEGYMIFLHQCSIKSSEKDKIILLLLSHFLRTGPNQEYLCRENNMVLMVPSSPKHLSFSTEGPAEEVALLMNSLQAEMESWSLTELEGMSGENALASELCTELDNVQEFTKFLELGSCITFTQNRSTISLIPKEKNFYYFQTFPLIDSESESPLWDLIVASSPVTSSLVNYNAELSGHKIYISRRNENPAHQFLRHRHITDSFAHRLSVHHVTKLSMLATLGNNSECLQDLENHDFLLYAATHTLWIGPARESSKKKSCFSSLSDDTISILEKSASENMAAVNMFWPTCSYNMIVTWPHKTSAVSDWDYLPSECKTREIVLLIATVIITFIMSLGNVCALVVIIKSTLQKESSFLIYASIALADLLLGVFPGTLAVYDTLALMMGFITLQDYNPNFWNESLDQLKLHHAPDLGQLRFERSGFPMFCSMVINISLGVSLLSLVLLGTEQLKALMRKPFQRHQVVIGITVTWIISIIYAVLMSFTTDGWSFIGYFDPVTKLTFSVGTDGATISHAVFYTVVASIALAGFAVFVLVISTSFLVHYHSQYPSKAMIANVVEDRKNQQQATRRFQLIVAFSVISCVPLLIDKVVNLRSSSPLCHFLIYWISLALLSWKWSLYTLTHKSFRRNARHILLWRSHSQSTPLKSQLSQMENDDLETTQLNMELRSISSNDSNDSGSEGS